MPDRPNREDLPRNDEDARPSLWVLLAVVIGGNAAIWGFVIWWGLS